MKKQAKISVAAVALAFLYMPFSSFLSVFARDVSTKTDGEALLLFKKDIQKDPGGVLSNWKLSQSLCSWYGVTCEQDRVTRLDLCDSNLTGVLSFYSLASLNKLVTLNLSMNSFSLDSSPNLVQLPQGLSTLDLSSSGVVGPIPNGFISNYPFLAHLNLSYNNLTGYVPENLLTMVWNLRVLDLSFNNLSGSISTTKIDPSCNSLLYFDLSGNQITGNLPMTLSKCSNLKTLNLSLNNLVGEIPPSYGELQCLEELDISSNQLTSTIPFELGNACGSLRKLKLSNNNISGSIPISLSSCSFLQLLDLANNNITGPLQNIAFHNLTSLDSLLLSNNFISGTIPSSISFCKALRIADFSSNKLTGSIPTDICTKESSLEEIRAPDNLLEGNIPPELTNCLQLKTIDLSINYIKGPIPEQIGRLQNLEHLMAWFNGISGVLPSGLGQCWRLKTLILNNNFITGNIPVELFNSSNLEWISLTGNDIQGQIPTEFGNFKRLAVLQLGNNSLSGEIPREFANCSSLVWLDLSSNRLTGTIPPRLGRQPGATTLNGILSGNTLVFVRNVGNSCKGAGGLLEFAGIRPERLLQVSTLKTCDFTRLYSGAALNDWTHYQTLEYLDLSYNELEGHIPDEFADMSVLQVLDLAHNKISGEIPSSFGRLRNIGVFDASHNRLQGSIPESLSNLSFLVQIDLSNNELTGEIPSRGQLSTLPASQYANNKGLCGVPLPPCWIATSTPSSTAAQYGNRKRRSSAAAWANSMVLGVLVSAVSVCVIIVWTIAMHAKRKEAKSTKMLNSLQASHAATTWVIGKEKEALSINVATFQRQLKKLKFSQLIEATNGFSAASLIGCGGFGEVFKATLKDGTIVAIKKLVRLSYQGDREFMAEMETLGKIKHKNLVPLFGYCKVGEERLLVYEYMRYGSLEDMLHGHTKPRETPLSWNERKTIARGAAKGLCFLHHNCIPHIIHRDMKSSNVLLDDNMEARVSDFGMARLISALDTHLSVSTLAGTPGYVPPEYYQSFRCTSKGDVYSFGVVMLEIITGRRPTDKEDYGDTNLVGWVRMQIKEGKGKEVIDSELMMVGNADEEKEMMRYLEITMQCVEDFPSRRPNMLQVVSMMRELRPVEAEENRE